MTREAQAVVIAVRVRQLKRLADLTAAAYVSVEDVLMEKLQQLAADNTTAGGGESVD